MNRARQLTAWLANQLQVDAPWQVRSWLLRLVVRRPAQRPWQPLDDGAVPDPLLWLARALDVPAQAPAWQWLLRLFILPPSSTRSFAPWVRALLWGFQLLGWLVWKLLATAWHVAAWPMNLLLRLLGGLGRRLDAARMGPEAEALMRPLLRRRGMAQLVLALGIAAVCVVITTPLNGYGQFVFLSLAWMLSIVLRQVQGRFAALSLATISLVAMGRYAWWRMQHTLHFDYWIEAVLGYGLLAAEAYTWLIVVFGFIQTAWPLHRKPQPLAGAPESWPTVDVFIPTYNEPLEVVRPTVLAALALDWPADKLRVHLLDDGRRELMRSFAAEFGVNYITRPDNRHAKAGNLNHALAQTQGELVAIFDCDHIPVHSFLKTAVGWFQRDSQCAMLQTPHHFFSPDPFERNLGTFRRVPNEGALFYGLIQDGNDFWNATFFCGSCAVLRRGPLLEVGGIAVETVTEDAHTALKLHRRGYRTAYIRDIQAAGLATESLSAHIGQRIRWARGMAQIFRVDNPFLGKGLTLWQRICYGNAMLHFFFGLPRLVFLTAPMVYLFFGLHVISTTSLLLLLYVIPYIVQAVIANAYIQGPYRHTFWAEVYETVLAWYIALPTTVALIAPKLGKFNVTAKGGLVEQAYFDSHISRPYVVLVLLNLAALGFGLWYLCFSNERETVALLLNLVWTLYSVFMLGAAMGVAGETRQVRRMHRVATRLRAALYLPGGYVLPAECRDYSLHGLGLRLPPGQQLAPGTRVDVGLWTQNGERTFPARVMLHGQDGTLGLQFLELTQQQQIDLVQSTFARADAWTGWSSSYEANDSAHTLRDILQMSGKGYRVLWNYLRDQLRRAMPAARTTLSDAPAADDHPLQPGAPLSYKTYQAAQAARP